LAISVSQEHSSSFETSTFFAAVAGVYRVFFLHQVVDTVTGLSLPECCRSITVIILSSEQELGS